jgi:hypothetical protein
MTFHEVNLNEEVLDLLIRFSEDWAAENSCYGYRPNGKSDIEGNRIFFAEDGNAVIGYLLGKVYRSEQMKSIMPEGTPCFEVEELYIVPGRRSQGVGANLFKIAGPVIVYGVGVSVIYGFIYWIVQML